MRPSCCSQSQRPTKAKKISKTSSIYTCNHGFILLTVVAAQILSVGRDAMCISNSTNIMFPCLLR